MVCVEVSVVKSDVSVLCSGLCCQVRCKCSVLWSLFPSQMKALCALVSVAKSDVSVLCFGLGCQVRCECSVFWSRLPSQM